MLTDNPTAPLILVVEDDDNHAELIQRSFEDAPEQYRVDVVTNFNAAKGALELRTPALVLTDFRLPDGYGSDLVALAQGRWPVIMMTSHGNEQVAVEAMKIGAYDYIVKSPETFAAMPRTISFALQTWSLILARRAADEAALRAKRDWERTFDAVPDLISIIDVDHTITRVNRAMAERCGFSADEIVGRKCYETVHGLQDVPCCCPAVTMMQDKQVHTKDIEEKQLNGFFDVTVSPLYDDQGQVSAYVHVMRDISQHKKTEALVQQRLNLREIALTSNVDELMQATVDACEQLTESSIGFFHLVEDDQQHLTLQAWSKNTLATMCTAEGHGQHYPISKAGVWVECFHTREPVIHNDYPSLPKRKGMPFGHAPVQRELTVPVVMNDKVVSILGVGNKSTPYTEHDAHIVKQFVSFASEVIGRKKATVALRESEERHRKLAHEQQIILNTSSVGICFLKDRKVMWTNPAFDLIFGYAPGKTQGLSTSAFYPDKETYEQVGDQAYATIESGAIYSHDVMMIKKDGDPLWCNLVGQAINPGNHDDGSIWVMMDITDRIKAEQERLLLEQQFQQTQKLESLGVLAGGIAHDFNNILTIILGHCFMANQELDSGMTDKVHVEQIEKAANRAAELCHQMLAYAGKSPLVNVQINLWLMVDEIVKMLQSAIKKNVDITLDLQRDVPAISGDNAQIQQIVMNLIINAAEAIGDTNGTIKVALNRFDVTDDHATMDFLGNSIPAGPYACLEVADSGCGMDEETKRRIFEPFYTTKFTGRGLGMSAILGIIKSHEGALQLTSNPGDGTIFRVYLPLQVAQETAGSAQTIVAPVAATVSGTVLLVDDEESLRTIGAALLNAMGFTVVTAANGREALEIYRERGATIDLVLLDLIMPEMGGVATYHELRKIKPSIPVVICSGYGLDGVLEDIDNDSYLDSIQKPYKPDQLRSSIVHFLEKTS